jgi:hypothetical protein
MLPGRLIQGSIPYLQRSVANHCHFTFNKEKQMLERPSTEPV